MPVLRARGEQFFTGEFEREVKSGLEVHGQSGESILVAKSNFQSMSCAGTSLTPAKATLSPHPMRGEGRGEGSRWTFDDTGQGQGKPSTQPQRESNLELLLAACISFSLRRSRCGRRAHASLHPKTRLRM